MQIDLFLQFGLSETSPCPFPMKAERHALRNDAECPFAHNVNIFRNRYERIPPVDEPRRTQHPRRWLEDNPDAIEIMKIVRERYGDT
jgi:hypothetical protein